MVAIYSSEMDINRSVNYARQHQEEYAGNNGYYTKYNPLKLSLDVLRGTDVSKIDYLKNAQDTITKENYQYLLQRQAEVGAGNQIAKASTSNPLLQTDQTGKDVNKALDKATALLNSLRQGKTLLG